MQVILTLLNNAISADNVLRTNALQQLDAMITFDQIVELLMTRNKLGEIYFNYWLQTNYATNRQIINELVTKLYDGSEYLEKALFYLIQQSSLAQDHTLLAWLHQTNFMTLKYRVLKYLYQEHGDANLLEFCTFALNQPCDDVLKLKFLILSTGILKYEKNQLWTYIQWLKTGTNVYKIQKLILYSLQRQKGHCRQELEELLQDFRERYFKKEQSELRLIVQAISILKTVCLNCQFDLNELDDPETESELQEVELILYEVYFEEILGFLIRSIRLNEKQIQVIYNDPEAHFAEVDNEGYEIRDVAAEFLHVALSSIKGDYLCNLIQSLQTQIVDFNTMIDQEAIFYLKRTCLFDLQIDYFKLFNEILPILYVQNALYLPVQIQILHLCRKYLSEQQDLAIELYQLMEEKILHLNIDNICVILIQIECINLLNVDQQLLLQIWPCCKTLYQKCKQQQSKVTIFEFYGQLVIKNAMDCMWMIHEFINEWNSAELHLKGKIMQILLDIIKRNSVDIDLYNQILSFSMLDELSQQWIEIVIWVLQKPLKAEIVDLYTKAITQLVSIDLWRECVVACVFILQQQFNESLIVQLLTRLSSMVSEIKENAFIEVMIPIEIYLTKTTNPALVYGFLPYFTELPIYCAHLLSLLKQQNALSVEQGIYDKITMEAYNVHRNQPPLRVSYYQHFIYLVGNSFDHTFYLEQQAKSLVKEGPHLVKALRAILPRGISCPELKCIEI